MMKDSFNWDYAFLCIFFLCRYLKINSIKVHSFIRWKRWRVLNFGLHNQNKEKSREKENKSKNANFKSDSEIDNFSKVKNWSKLILFKIKKKSSSHKLFSFKMTSTLFVVAIFFSSFCENQSLCECIFEWKSKRSDSQSEFLNWFQWKECAFLNFYM